MTKDGIPIRTSSSRANVASNIEQKVLENMTVNEDKLMASLGSFWPYSAGEANQLLELTLVGLAQLPTTFEKLVENPLIPVNVNDMSFNSEKAEILKVHFDKYGSDKARSNEYHKFYSSILSEEASALFEIGLGTNNANVPSNMGVGGRPGASLRAFRDYLPNCQIYGADIDEGILFQEDRIETRQVDQLSQQSLNYLKNWLPPLDLFIDDGLHSFAANLNSLVIGLELTKPGGWIIIEDIMEVTFPLWKVVADLRIENDSYLIRAGTGCLFAMRKS